MGQTLLAAVASGLALAGAIAVAGIGAARFGRSVPHLGIGGLGAAVALLAARLSTWPGPVALLVVAVAGAAAGCVACTLDRRARDVDAAVWPPSLLPEVAVLGLALGIAGLARTTASFDLPLGPLGGLASTPAAILACAAGLLLAPAVVVGPVGRRAMPGWALTVGGTAVVVALGAGLVAVRGDTLVPAFGVPDVVGLALRAVAVGVFARRGVAPGIAAAVVLGVGEALLRSQLSTGEAALVPAVAVVAWGVWAQRRRSPVTAAA